MEDNRSNNVQPTKENIKVKPRSLAHRGYYTELVTDLDYKDEIRTETELKGAHKRTKLLWQVKTATHAPVIKEIVKPKKNVFLAPAERWMTFDEDRHISFPVDTFKPKVQLQHEVDPQTLPRSVAIERRRREYQGKTVQQVLDQIGIESKQILPLQCLRSHAKQEYQKAGLYTWVNYLPLELFDDEDFDSRSPETWLQHGVVDGIRYPIPGEAFVPYDTSHIPKAVKDMTPLNYLYKWVNVAVTDYDFKYKLWCVLTLDGEQRTFKLPRIYVMFKAEDPYNFGLRIKSALDRRSMTEHSIRYDFFLDNMMLEGVPDMDDHLMHMIDNLVTRGGQIKIKKPKYYKEVLEQVKLCFKRALAELDCRKTIDEFPHIFRFLVVPPKCIPEIEEKPYIDTGMVDDFTKKCEYFRWYSIYVIPETYQAMYFIASECLKVSQMSLFNSSYGAKSVSLEEFESIQNLSSNNVLKQLRGPWLEALVFNMRMCIGDLGKGWFDINEKIFATYLISKLFRFMELVKHRMQYSVRLLVMNSIQMYINLVETPCIPCFEVEEDFAWGDNWVHSPFKPNVIPLFTIQLKIDESEVFYNTPPEEFESTLIYMFDEAVRQTHYIKQVHPALLQHLRFPKDLYLTSVGLLAEEVCNVRERIKFAYQKAIIPLKAYATEFKVFLPFYNLSIAEYVEKFKKENHSAYEVKEEVSLQMRLKESLEKSLPRGIVIGPFNVSVDTLKTMLINKRMELCNKLLDMFAAGMKKLIEGALQDYGYILLKLGDKPTNIHHILEIREWIETIPTTVKTIEDNVRRLCLDYEVLEFFHYILPQEDFENKWEAVGMPYKIMQAIEKTESFLLVEEERFYKIQLSDEVALHDKIDGLVTQVSAMSGLKDFEKVHEIAVDMRKVWKALKESQEQANLLNMRQKMFGQPVVPFDTINKLIKEFEPYKNLWISSSDWLRLKEALLYNPIINVDPEGLERNITEMYKTMTKLIKVFSEIQFAQDLAVMIKASMDEFKPMVPLIVALRNPGMRQRHWDSLKEQTGINILWTTNLTFSDCLNFGVSDHTEIIQNLADVASKESGIEQTLLNMKEQWLQNEMELTPYKDTGTFIMKISDELQQLLDDHIVQTQQISFSPYKGAFEKEIEEWESTLKVTSEVIDEWMDVQKQWMYLEPIFTSPDITEQLPVESKKYKSMERTWKRILRNASEMPNIIYYCGDRKLLESLKDCNRILQIVQKGLSDYLETKRAVFPRFYFLSDDELLEILSQARNPLSVQPHLRKCFENIALLTFEEDLRITQMFSSEDECVDLNPTFYPLGSVEQWLNVVEETMKNTLRSIIADSLVDMYEKTRAEWVLRWPGQVVICCSQTFWTSVVEEGIVENKLEDVYKNTILVNMDALRNLVRGPLELLHRRTLSALIVIEVHSRDVTEILVENKISNINDFDWISKLRYYWVEGEMKVRAVNAEFQYGYEYLGNSGRLVVTPLTDRCYLTLTGALHLNFGGAPAGPAGTGKTETTKDLAKAIAVQCVVFNCSDQLDFMAMGKFFKGLASAGAWACFDEFNRIDIEVLSVVAQQITTIQKAQQARLNRFIFEGVEIGLKASCAVFITMNPGYAGRTELPDNLKALFRPVSMMVPDYSLIAEIMLFSFGFGNAKQLANKITTTFKLSSEQLSSQNHYDFGMRAVKTVIAVAGNLKREKPEMEENQIVLRSLRDVNVPKFLKDDLKLFNGIVSDLFPRMQEIAVDYGVLELSIRACTLEKGLLDVDGYVKKVIELYETTVVRHGLMLVGPTGSGKTKCYEILKDAMTALQGKPQPSGLPFQPCHTYVLNPKSITMGQLYGEFDLQTHEWTDGILPCLVRQGIIAPNKHRRWYIFDGPVDAVWIENMNTVLDDNRKLCLSSGEIIKLRDTMNMVFEVADLAEASPATVSRCGMVYLEPGILGLNPFVTCWLKKLPELAKEYRDKFEEMFQVYAIPAIELLRDKLREILTSIDSAILRSFTELLDDRMMPISPLSGKSPPAAKFLDLIPGLIVPWCMFALIWSIGSTCDNDGRVIFDKWLRQLMADRNEEYPFPANGLVYDYNLHDGGFKDSTDDGEPAPPKWVHWMSKVEEYNFTVDGKYSDIEIPTIDNVRNAVLLGIILENEHNVLAVGPTGTGKTLTIMAKLSRNMHKKFVCDFISFSARTSANQTQDLIDSKLDRRRKGVFGPPILKRQIFFIDDFNMPALEVYGAQPPIELIRQWMDFSGWYDRKSIGEFRTIIDVNFVAAMGPPGGGRNPVTARLLRHFHFLAFPEIEIESKRRIFGQILNFWIGRTPNCAQYFEPVLGSTLSVYATILEELLPTPAKTHYTFNLRDLSKVFQGMLMFEPDKLSGIHELIRLWFHECCRVFQDRLVNDEDRDWFENLLKSKIKSHYKQDPDEALGKDIILFGDFIDPAQAGSYKQMQDMDELYKSLEYYLGEYNGQSTRPMRLVLFLDAMSHICKISRIIRQPLGNALLLGMGGSGRQSLTRLSAFIAEYTCSQIELTNVYGNNEWRDDIKSLMLNSAIYNRETVFLFSDTQIKSESFLEDLNNILNSGDVPNIYQPEELDTIYQAMRIPVQDAGLPSTKSNLFAVYQKLVRSNLHTVITMSPIGEVFRARLRQFPALVNCCTIDWFSAWPDSALQSVALQFMREVPDLAANEVVLNGVVKVCQYMHASVVEASIDYLEELGRHNYVTPTSYLELLSSYTTLLNKRKNALTEGVGRLQIGLEKMNVTSEEVSVLQVNLGIMRPILESAAKEAEIMIAQIAKDTAVAEETKEIVEKEEMEATKKALQTQAIAEDAQKDLDEAMPELLAAEASLKALNKNDITEVRSMKRPPAGVVTVIEAICIVKNVKPIKVPGEKPGEKVLDYWEPGRNLLTDPGMFLTSLMNFDKDSITEVMIESLKKYVLDPNFTPAKIAKVSKACTSLCMWIHAMYKYYFVNKRVLPKKAALKQANEELEITEKALAAAKAKMAIVMEGLRRLQKELADKIAFKEEKEKSVVYCEERMNRAVRLLGGLAEERVRWANTIKSTEGSVVNVTGDILVCAGCVAYMTPFSDTFRRKLFAKWLESVREQGIPFSDDISPVTTLGDPILIRTWQIAGLPRDYLSTENAVLVACSRRWPLFIDPQQQANKWIKNLHKDKGLSICKLTDKNLMRTMESAIRFGKPVLIENIKTELDPALDPVLLHQIYLQAGTWVIKLGEMVVPYDEEFKLFVTTKLPNPHFTPELSVKVLVVNFTLVQSGLEDQLLALVVAQERPDLEEQRSQIVVSLAQMKNELTEIENRILYKLSTSEGSPLDDLDFIITLESSKVKSIDIKNNVESAEITQIDIDNTRALYIPVSVRAAILFFCVSDLSNIDPMYQYSLEWFIKIFISSISDTEKNADINIRVSSINDYFTFSLFCNVCRSLFEIHKLMFAFILCIRILMNKGEVEPQEWHYLLAGGAILNNLPNPAPDWLSTKTWNEILALQNLPRFKSFVDTFNKNKKAYKDIFISIDPHKMPLPPPFEDEMDAFQKLVLIKTLRPDKFTNAMQDFLAKKLGQHFIEPQSSDLSLMYKESSTSIPMIFVLSTGTDPAADLYKFADRMKMNKRLFSISLGQGQGPRAESMMKSGMEQGSWVFFQNCHLAPSWMPRLDRLVEEIVPEDVHRDFRIWLTSTPSPNFPVSILQNGCKMTVEPPSGIKANMLRSFLNQVSDFADFMQSEDAKAFPFKMLVFSLCLFHGVLLERRKYGPLGFNIPYEFTDGDLKICVSQLHMFLIEYEKTPFKVLSYTAGEINYGGRVTDDWDRRCLMHILADYYKDEVVSSDYVFDEDGIYHQMPADTIFLDYIDYIKTFPLNDKPEMFGLHLNADIAYAQTQTYSCLATLLQLQQAGASGGSAASQEEEVSGMARQILETMPKQFDLDLIMERYPVKYEESLNTVIIQEGIRYNKLLVIIEKTLQDILKALKGLVVMSETLERMSTSIFSNLVPEIWASKAYPSLKPLGAWVTDLKARCDFLQNWVDNGIPPVFWISGFYFPQAFLTGTLQNYARQHVVAIDTIGFRYEVLDTTPTESMPDGCCIYGLFLEGCRWDPDIHSLNESFPKELYTDMPVIWMIPEENHKKPGGVYECPVYKTLTRAGTLSTTGHSTNYVVAVELPSIQSEHHWIKRGVALMCALNF